QIVAFEETAQEIGEYAAQVGEADFFTNPQTFDLMEHGRMGSVGVDTIDATGRDNTNLRHRRFVLVFLDMRLHIANLHRAGVGAQQNVLLHGAVFGLQVKGVVHGAGRVLFRRVQRGEVVPVALDLWTVGNFETNGAEQLLDAIKTARDRMQAAARTPATGQRDIQRLGGKLGFKRGALER